MKYCSSLGDVAFVIALRFWFQSFDGWMVYPFPPLYAGVRGQNAYGNVGILLLYPYLNHVLHRDGLVCRYARVNLMTCPDGAKGVAATLRKEGFAVKVCEHFVFSGSLAQRRTRGPHHAAEASYIVMNIFCISAIVGRNRRKCSGSIPCHKALSNMNEPV